MIQDIGKTFDNTYRIEEPKEEDTVFLFDHGNTALRYDAEGNAVFPKRRELPKDLRAQYLFRIGGELFPSLVFLALQQRSDPPTPSTRPAAQLSGVGYDWLLELAEWDGQ